jgi:hypothetical protein
MQAHGYLKPVVAGEHAGPQPFEFPEAMAVMQETFAAAFAEAAGAASQHPHQGCGDTQITGAVTAVKTDAGTAPERRGYFPCEPW